MRPVWRVVRWPLRALGALLAVVLLLTVIASVWGTMTVRPGHPAPPPVVNDVTQLNPVPVARVLAPTTTAEIVEAVRTHAGPVSIGGGRYSMGGQTATLGALQLDMRRFDRILAIDTAARTITVQAGARWRAIQEAIDPLGLSVKIMQTYANFTVGGSLSVNVHGRYVGLGPIALSVRRIQLVLADGSVVEATPTRNREIFYGALGGYGALGVITEATLDLAQNVRVKRRSRTMPIGAYRDWFARQVRDSSATVFHNADIYPDDYETVNAVSYVRTEEPVTVTDRLIPANRDYGLNRFVYWAISEWPFGKALRQHVVDPALFRDAPVTWRNYEASYDVAELEPASRARSTYVLQEYFVPVERFDAWIPKMRAVFRKHDVNVINVSIRHALPDPGTVLAWAPRESFAFVVYYKQGTSAEARRAVGTWTREMIDSVLTVGGTYYLPYQPHATEAQFHRAYPRARELFALKRRLDPANKLRNTLWDRYYAPYLDPAAGPLPPEAARRLAARAGYARDEGQTYLTHPEWYIVYSSDEYAAWLRDRLPTEFPYLASIGQFWENYAEARALTRDHPFNGGYHVMLGVIGTSYSAELALKGVYENTIGRFSGWTADGQLTPEDRFAHEVAADYGRFIHVRPWYEYRFAPRLAALWTDLPRWGPHAFRSWERKLFLSTEYGVKALYATAIEKATRAAYVPQDDRMQLVVAGWSDAVARRAPRLARVETLDSVRTLAAAPRYDEFRDVLLGLAREPGTLRILEIAGNDEILLTGVAPAGWEWRDARAQALYTLPLPSDPSRRRVAMRVPVRELLPVLRDIQAANLLRVDHLYDY